MKLILDLLAAENPLATQLPSQTANMKAGCSVCGGKLITRRHKTCDECRDFFQKDREVVNQCITGKHACEINENTQSKCKHCWLKACWKANLRGPTFERKGQRICKVCDRTLKWFHGTRPVCKSCRNFFYRNWNSKKIPSCRKNCETLIRNWECCKSCRLQKCFKYGMTVCSTSLAVPDENNEMLSGVDAENDEHEPATPEAPMMNRNISNHLDEPGGQEINYDAMADHDIPEPSAVSGLPDEVGGTSSLTRSASLSGQFSRLNSAIIPKASVNISNHSDESGNEEVDYNAMEDHDILEQSDAPGHSDEAKGQSPKLILSVISEVSVRTPNHSDESDDSDESGNEEVDYDAMADYVTSDPYAAQRYSDDSDDDMEAFPRTSRHSDVSGKKDDNYDASEHSDEASDEAMFEAAPMRNGVSKMDHKYNSQDSAGKQNMLQVTMAVLVSDAVKDFGKHCYYHDFDKKKETMEIIPFEYNASYNYYQQFEQLANLYFGDFLKNIENMLSFLETAPGFEDLSKDDIKILIKQNIHVLHFLWSLPGFIGSEFILTDGTKLSETELERIFTPDFYEDVPDFLEYCQEQLKINEKQRMLLILLTASQSNFPVYKHKFSADTLKIIVQNYEGFEEMLVSMPVKYEQDDLQEILKKFNEFNRKMEKLMVRYREHRKYFKFPDTFDFYFGKEE